MGSHSRGPPTIGGYEWEAVLKLSTMWECGDTRTVAIQELSKIKIGEAEKIMLSKEYGVASWLFKGYTELAKREEIVSEEEGEILGPETVVRLLRVREAGIKASFVKAGCKNHLKRTEHNYEDAIREMFAQQLTDAEQPHASVDPTVPPSQCHDDHPPALLPKRNEKFYMKSIVFLVRRIRVRVPCDFRGRSGAVRLGHGNPDFQYPSEEREISLHDGFWNGHRKIIC